MSIEQKIDSNFEISLLKRTRWVGMHDSHFHNGYELYYLLEGEVYYFIENAVYSVKKGDMVLIPRNLIHKTSSRNKPDCKRVLISFQDSFVFDMLKYDKNLLDCFNLRIISLSKQNKKTLENIIGKLLNEFGGIYEPNYALIKALLCELLILLCRNVGNDELKNSVQIDNITSQKIIEVVEYINKEYKQDITLEMLAKQFYMSSAYLSRLFKKVTGFHYSEYLTNVRIKQAVYLLSNSNYNVTQIALNTGYNSSNHFCKSFKSVMGISPLKYKRRV